MAIFRRGPRTAAKIAIFDQYLALASITAGAGAGKNLRTYVSGPQRRTARAIFVGCMSRSDKEAQRGEVYVLSGPIYRHHVHDPHPTTDALLRLQHHHPVRALIGPRSRYVSSASRRRREDRTWYD